MDESPPDPTAATVAENIRRARARRGKSTYELSALLTEAGHTVSQSALSRMERGLQRVTVSDLMALAVVLDVSPLGLLLPLGDDGAEAVDVTGGGTLPLHRAWSWAQGYEPLNPEGDPRTAAWEFRLYSLPPGLRHLPGNPYLTMEGDE
ncbi:Helix-turn-helix protein [Streptomyces sp. YIM 121038]|nr:Helix-turn-helix protein [Streptomyces sp. YIM 121038]